MTVRDESHALPLATGSLLAFASIAMLVCHWGWEHTTLYAPLFADSAEAHASIWLTNNLFNLAGIVCIFVLSRYVQRVCKSRLFALVACACEVIGTAGLMVPSVFSLPEGLSLSLYIAANAVASTGCSLFIIRIYSALRSCASNVIRYIVFASGMAGSLVLYVLINALPVFIEYLLVLVIPVLLLFCILTVEKAGLREETDTLHEGRARPAFTLRVDVLSCSPMISLMLFAASINFLRTLYTSNLQGVSGGGLSSLFATAAIMVILLSILEAFLQARLRTYAGVFFLAVMVAASAIVSIATPENFFLRGSLVVGSFFTYVTFMYQTVFDLSGSNEDRWVKATSLGLLFNGAGLLIGTALAHALLPFQQQATSAFAIVTLTIGYVVFAAAALLSLYYSRVRRSVLRMADADVAGRAVRNPLKADAAGVAAAEAGDDALGIRCQAMLDDVIQADCAIVASQHALTARELDVFVALVNGKNLPAIASELGITSNTAKSHISHLYQKMGVHSREELFEALRDAEAVRFPRQSKSQTKLAKPKRS